MGVSGYFEFVTTLLGWVLYNNIWAILADTGIVFIPIVAMMISNIKDSHAAGDDEGNAAVQSLKKIEADFLAMMAVFIFAVMPTIDVELGEMRYTKPRLECTAGGTPPAPETVSGSDTGTTHDYTLQVMANEKGKIPLWWAVLHWLSKAVTSAAVASIPCSVSFNTVEYELAEANFKNPDLHGEMQQFTRDCWQRAHARYLEADKTGLTEDDTHSTAWLGSSYFLDNADYYNRYMARAPVAAFAYDAARDESFAEDTGEGGYPNCKDWWENATHGLKARTLGNIEPGIKDNVIFKIRTLFNRVTGGTLSTDEQNNTLLRKYLSVQRSTVAAGAGMAMATSYGDPAKDKAAANLKSVIAEDVPFYKRGWLALKGGLGYQRAALHDAAKATVTIIGGGAKAPGALTEGYTMRSGIAFYQPLGLLMLVVALPFVMIFGGYRLDTLIKLSVFFFGFHFLTFLWALAYWLDNQLSIILLGGTVKQGVAGIFNGSTNLTQATILQYTSRFLYLVMPGLYLAAVGWVGFNAGTGFTSALQSQSKNSGAIGTQAVDTAVSAVKVGASLAGGPAGKAAGAAKKAG
ncbi:MAG: conjugal transfer protein TraG N-terminal domain-containing protein [Parahaliea sp.]